MTLVAWAPPSWQEAADQTLAGLAHGHPSRAILLMPRATEDDVGGPHRVGKWAARVEVRPLGKTQVAAEVIAVDLPGGAPGVASIVTALVRPDLPVFLRWRGAPPVGREPFDSLIELADRLIVDSSEWPDPEGGYSGLSECFDRAACSDIAWRRLEPWRRAIASRWPGAREASRLHVRGPPLESRLLTAWLSERLARDVALEHSPADELAAVELDGHAVQRPRFAMRSASELLSSELEQVRRSPIFEEAACALSSVTI